MLVQRSKNLAKQNWESLRGKNLFNFMNFDKTAIKPTLSKERRLIE